MTEKGFSAVADKYCGDTIYIKAFITRFVLDFLKSLGNLEDNQGTMQR